MLFGFFVFAIDLGREYLIQGELQTVADNAAMAAATQLVGTALSTSNASVQWTGALDTADGNDNRFNLRMNHILGVGPDNLASTTSVDFFAARLDALGNVNGSQTGANAKYARVQVCAQAPLLFTRFINPLYSTGAFAPCSTIAVSAVAGISAPICTACGIGVLAIVDPSAGTDPINFGMSLGSGLGFYTLYLDTSMQSSPTGPTCTTSTPSALAGTDTDGVGPINYVILDHVPTGGLIDPDGTLYELAAGGDEQTDSDTIGPGTPPSGGVATIGGTQGFVGVPEATYGTYDTSVIPTLADPGEDVICGLNTAFGVDPSLTSCGTNASVGAEFEALSAFYTEDTDPGTGTYAAGGFLEDYSTEYAGNLRRVITLPVVDAVSTLNVQGYRQFLLETDSTSSVGVGLNPTPSTGSTCQTGAFPAQYIGWPVPLRCGTAGGMCSVSYGVGRTVLHCGTPSCTVSTSGP